MKKILFWLKCARAYSLPMSITAWLVPFVFGLTNHGSFVYGIVALLGVIAAHLGANLFDDYMDYKRYIKNGKKTRLQKGYLASVSLCRQQGHIQRKRVY